MATEFVCNINGSASEDYNTLSAWEAAMDDVGDITTSTVVVASFDNHIGTGFADLETISWSGGDSHATLYHLTDDQILVKYTSGTFSPGDTLTDTSGNTIDVSSNPDSVIIVAECYDDDGALTDQVVVDGFTTSATNYVKITVPEGERHDGTFYGGGFKIDSTSAGYDYTLKLNDLYSIAEWLIICGVHSQWGHVRMEASTDEDYCVIRNCILKQINQTGSSHIGIQLGGAGYDIGYIYNNIVFGYTGNGISIYLGFTGSNKVYNNTVYDCAIGVSMNGSSLNTELCYNNLSIGNTADFVFGGSTHDYNFSKDDTATGANSINGDTDGKTPDFVSTTATEEDFHLQSTSDAIGAGTSLSGTFTDDIDGQTRVNAWDIGADEYFGPIRKSLVSLDILLKKYISIIAAGGLSKALSDSITVTDALIKEFFKVNSDSITVTDTLQMLFQKILSDSATVAETLVKEPSVVISDSITVTESAYLHIAKVIIDTITATDTLSKNVQKVFDETITVTEAISLLYKLVLSDSITVTDTSVKSFFKVLSDSSTVTDTLVKAVFKQISDTITVVESSEANLITVLSSNYRKTRYITAEKMLKRHELEAMKVWISGLTVHDIAQMIKDMSDMKGQE